MGAVTISTGTKTTLTSTALDSLASATYVEAGTIDVSALNPLDVIIEVEATPGTVSSFKQVSVFVQTSLDGVDYSTGPVSGTTTTNEANLKFIGVVPLGTNAQLQRNSFSILAALKSVPPYFKVICKNETGAALAASGHKVSYAVVTGNVA